jgi:hypothetical protein
MASHHQNSNVIPMHRGVVHRGVRPISSDNIRRIFEPVYEPQESEGVEEMSPGQAMVMWVAMSLWAMPQAARAFALKGRANLRCLAGYAASIAIASTWVVVTAYAVSLWVLP